MVKLVAGAIEITVLVNVAVRTVYMTITPAPIRSVGRPVLLIKLKLTMSVTRARLSGPLRWACSYISSASLEIEKRTLIASK